MDYLWKATDGKGKALATVLAADDDKARDLIIRRYKTQDPLNIMDEQDFEKWLAGGMIIMDQNHYTESKRVM